MMQHFYAMVACLFVMACGSRQSEPTHQPGGASGGSGVTDSSSGGQASVSGPSGGVPGTGGAGVVECNDHIDNDGDGLVDWQFDQGCTSQTDTSESGTRGAIKNGWTVFKPSGDSRIVYVSATGNDSADGLTPNTAKRTAAAGAKLLRNGSADWILFRRGESFSGLGESALSTVSGRSATERILVSAYGEGARPKLSGEEITLNGSHVAVTNLSFTNSHVYPGGTSEDLLVEGCLFEGGGFGSSEGIEGLRKNIALRRNAFARCGGPLYAASISGFLVEENVIYRPNENSEGNHGMYINDKGGMANVTTRGNLVYYGSAAGDGIKQRPGGVAENNIIVSVEWCSLHFEVYTPLGGRRGSARNNLILERRQSFSEGVGFQGDEWSGEAVDNIIADDPKTSDSQPVTSDTTISETGTKRLFVPADPARPTLTILGMYNADVMKGTSTTVAFFERALNQQKFDFSQDLTASTIITYVRQKYMR